MAEAEKAGAPHVTDVLPLTLCSETSLLTLVVLDHLLDLLLHRIEVEGSRVLHRRVIDCCQRQLLDELLDQDEAPELTGEEVVHVAGGAGVERFPANGWRALERVLPNIDH